MARKIRYYTGEKVQLENGEEGFYYVDHGDGTCSVELYAKGNGYGNYTNVRVPIESLKRVDGPLRTK